MKSSKFFGLLAILVLFNFSFSYNCTSDNKKPTKEVKVEKPQYEITVSQQGKELGKIIIETFPAEAPKHAANFDSLVSAGFYDGVLFHRVIPDFMIQGGDPNTKTSPNDRSKWGMGDPSLTRVPAEFNSDKPNWSHKRGILSAARANDPNSASTQFFIVHKDSPHLDKNYSIYGQVIKGIEVVDAVCSVPCDGRAAPNSNVSMTIKKISK